MYWPAKVWPVGMIARKNCSTIENRVETNLLNSLHHWTFHSKSTKVWFSMRKWILKSPRPWNRNSISVVNSKFLSIPSTNTLLAILKVTDVRRDVILTGGLNHRCPWRPSPRPPSPRWFTIMGTTYLNLLHRKTSRREIEWHFNPSLPGAPQIDEAYGSVF